MYSKENITGIILFSPSVQKTVSLHLLTIDPTLFSTGRAVNCIGLSGVDEIVFGF